MVVTVSLALGRWRLEDWKLKEVILSYTESSSYLELSSSLKKRKRERERERREILILVAVLMLTQTQRSLLGSSLALGMNVQEVSPALLVISQPLR